MELADGDNINGSQAPTKVKQQKIDQMKAVFFLIIAEQNRYSSLFKQLRDGEKVGRDEYPVTITSALDLLIQTEGGIFRNQQSTHDNRGGRGGCHQKVRMEHTFSQKRQGGTK